MQGGPPPATVRRERASPAQTSRTQARPGRRVSDQWCGAGTGAAIGAPCGTPELGDVSRSLEM